jgi:DNA end-binding protein Ku
MWTGTISFGLVTVPVKLYSAVDRKTVRFHQLSGKSGVRVAQKRVDPSTGEEVAYEDIVKGYELAPDRYVVIEPGELEALEPKKTKTIEIEEFVDLSQIDPVYYDHPYYLAPGPGGVQALPAAAGGDARDGQGGDRARGDPLQGAAGGDPPDGRRAGDGDDAVRRRSAGAGPPRRGRRGGGGEDDQARAGHRQAARRLAGGRLRAGSFRDTHREQVLELIERKAQGKAIAVQPAPEEVPRRRPT